MNTRVIESKLNNAEVLLKLTKDLFPNILPTSHISIEELRYLQGQQSVIRKLEELLEDN